MDRTPATVIPEPCDRPIDPAAVVVAGSPATAGLSPATPPPRSEPIDHALIEDELNRKGRRACRALEWTEEAAVMHWVQMKGHSVPLLTRLETRMFFDTGLRAKELGNITFGMCCNQKGYLSDLMTIPGRACKNGGTIRQAPDRVKHISPDTFSLLREHWHEERRLGYGLAENFVFRSSHCRANGAALSYSALRLRLRGVFIAVLGHADLLASHTPRKTLGNNVWIESGDIFAVKRALGHTRIESSCLYIDLPDSMVNKIIDASRERLIKRTASLRHKLELPLARGQTLMNLISAQDVTRAEKEVPLQSDSELVKQRRVSACAIGCAAAAAAVTRDRARAKARLPKPVQIPERNEPLLAPLANAPPELDPADEALAACA